jgi:hypothetical protein
MVFYRRTITAVFAWYARLAVDKNMINLKMACQEKVSLRRRSSFQWVNKGRKSSKPFFNRGGQGCRIISD